MGLSYRLLREVEQASVPKDDARVTEIVNGLIVTRPAKKVTYVSNQEKRESEPEVINLQEYGKSKAGCFC
jgi:hypothetical protein